MTIVNTVTAHYTYLQPLDIIYFQTRCNLQRISFFLCIIIIIIIIIILYIDSKVAVCRLGAIVYTIYPSNTPSLLGEKIPCSHSSPLNSAHCPPHFLFLTTPLHILCCGSARKVAKICLGNTLSIVDIARLLPGLKLSCEVLNIS